MENNFILSVDHDPDILEFMTTVLESKGYTVITAESGTDGLEVFKANDPAMIFVDLMMEEVDAGTNLVKEIKALGSKVPVYMLSSVGDAMTMNLDTSQLGIDGVLQKPLHPEELLKIVEDALAT